MTHSGSATASGGVANTGIHYGDINILPGTPVRTRYLEQVQRIAPPELVGRDAELAELAEFCVSQADAGTYAWWRAPAWSGKSALMSWFVLHPPRTVRIVSFFITARLASQNDRGAFIDNVLEQLLAMLGESLPPFLTESTRDAHLLGLLTEAAEACRERGEQFVLLVDGLDEDRGAGNGPDSHSIAALLPAHPPAGMRVVVAGRPNPPIPAEVPPHHPLRDESIVRKLKPSPRAQVVRAQMEHDLLRLLEGTAGEQDLLCLVTAAGGGLSAADLAELTGWSPWEINRRLRTVAGRSFSVRGSQFRPSGPEVFLLGHEQLQVTAEDMFGPARLAEYRERLHAWAQKYRARSWPEETPEYLLRGYFRMLHAVGDVKSMVALSTDADRQNRMLDLSGGDAVALSEISTALDMLAEEDEPDLMAMLRLAMHREHLSDRNSHMPRELPAAWAGLGQFHRAESLAESMPTESRVAAMTSLATAVLEGGDRRRACELLERAETVARSTSESGNQTWELVYVAEAVWEMGDRRWARGLLERAEAVARSTNDPSAQSRALGFVALSVSKTGDHPRARGLLERAEAVARSIADHNEQSAGLQEVAHVVAATGACTWAEKIARSITDDGWQAAALGYVARAVAKAGDHRRAEEIARSAATPDGRAVALGEAAEAIAEAGDRQRARELLERAEEIARSMIDDQQVEVGFSSRIDQEQALMLLSGSVAKTGDYTWAETMARSIAELARQSSALVFVARAAVEAGDHQRAETVASSLDTAEGQADVLVSLANAVTARGDRGRAREILEQVETVARSFTDPDSQASVLISLGDAVAKAGDRQQARDLWEQAEACARSAHVFWQEATLDTLMYSVAAGGHSEWAEEIARSLAEPEDRAQALAYVAGVVAEAGEHRRAEAIACSITGPEEQVEALVCVARAVADMGDGRRASEILDRAEEIACSAVAHDAEDEAGACFGIDPDEQVEVLVCVARAVADMGDGRRARAVMGRAEEITRSITESDWQAKALVCVARAVADMGDGRRALEMLERAEEIACLTTDREWQARRLASVARAVADMGDGQRARAVGVRAEEFARSIPDPDERAEALASVAWAVADTGDHQRAVEIARSVTEPNLQEKMLVHVARAVVKSGDYQGAQTTVGFIADAFRQTSALLEVVHAVAEAGEHRRAEEMARSIPRPDYRARALAGVAVAVVRAGDRGQTSAVRLIADALRLADWRHSLAELVEVAPGAAKVCITELKTL